MTEREFAPDVFVFGNKVAVFDEMATFEFDVPDPLLGSAEAGGSGDTVAAPMPGLVRKLSTSSGAAVKEGDPLIVLEAMKMEHTLTAPRDGVVELVGVQEGDQVEDGDILVKLEEANG